MFILLQQLSLLLFHKTVAHKYRHVAARQVKSFLILQVMGVALAIPNIAFAQPDTLWTSRFTGAHNIASGSKTISTFSSGYAVAGSIQRPGGRDVDMSLTIADSIGQLDWQVSFQGFDADSVHRSDRAYSLVQMPDSGYFLVGSSAQNAHSGMAVRTDASGNLRWHKYLLSILRVCALSDDGNLLICSTDSLWKIDDQADGEIIWQREFENIRWISAILNCNDGGFLVCGSSTGGTDMYAAKIDSEGETQWEEAYGTENADYCLAATQTQDGGWCLAGDAVSGEVGQGFEHFALIVRIDADGNQIWQHTYQGGRDDHWLKSVCETSDGGFAAAGYGSREYYMLRVDYFGEELWHEYYGGNICYSLMLMEDEGYTLAGDCGGSPSSYLVLCPLIV